LAADEIPATVSADALTMLETLPIALKVDDVSAFSDATSG
jgi:hypothetical protein